MPFAQSRSSFSVQSRELEVVCNCVPLHFPMSDAVRPLASLFVFCEFHSSFQVNRPIWGLLVTRTMNLNVLKLILLSVMISGTLVAGLAPLKVCFPRYTIFFLSKSMRLGFAVSTSQRRSRVFVEAASPCVAGAMSANVFLRRSISFRNSLIHFFH